jgi:glycine/D-amino acid oxidase-like deaminating enzyme
LATVDLTVRGAGIFGLAIAWEALRRGARVRVVDPGGLGAGASGGVVGALSPHTPDGWNEKKQFQLESLLMAEAFWAAISDVSGMGTGYGRTGRLQPLADAGAVRLAEAREAAAAERWGGAATWRVVDAGGWTWAPVSPTGLLVHDTLSARLDPARAVAATAAAIRAGGGEIVAEARDEGAVVWATGWRGLEDLSRALGRPVGGGVKGQALLLRADVPDDAPQIFVDGLHIVPQIGGHVAIGSTSENAFDDPCSVDAQLDLLRERAVAALPVLHGATVVRRWAGVRPRARTRAPLLGPWPGRAGQFVANGGFKIGFGIAPKVARVMADLVLEGRESYPSAFRVENSV